MEGLWHVKHYWLVVYLPLCKIWKSMGRMTTHILWEKCSKLPTRLSMLRFFEFAVTCPGSLLWCVLTRIRFQQQTFSNHLCFHLDYLIASGCQRYKAFMGILNMDGTKPWWISKENVWMGRFESYTSWGMWSICLTPFLQGFNHPR